MDTGTEEVERGKTVKTLSNTFVSIHENDLKVLNSHLQELSSKQNYLITEMRTEQKVYDANKRKDVDSMMQDVKLYKDKVQEIKKQMLNIHHRSKSLKKSAQELADFKVKEYHLKCQKTAMEEALVPKPSS